MRSHDPIVLARYLAAAWLLLLVYASLHPFSGWRDSGLPALAFLEGAWPRYWTVFDLVANVLGYLPFGFLLALALARLPGRMTGAVVAALLGAALSLAMEALQSWLPSRVPSSLDLTCNSLGSFFGALLALLVGARFFPFLHRWQLRLLAPVPQAEFGLTLLGIWLLIPLSPEILLFGAGDLRAALELQPALAFSAGSFPRLESAVVACNMVAVGLLARLLTAGRWMSLATVPLWLVVALLVRALGAAVLIGPEHAFEWWTPGVESGLLAGFAVLLPAMLLPASYRLVFAAMALMAGTVLVNLAPVNPYSLAALAAWKQGHFLNFNGLTRLVSIAWPFLALPYLMLAGRGDQA